MESALHRSMIHSLKTLAEQCFDWCLAEAELDPGVVDLIAGVDNHRLVIEVERRTDRIGNDLAKAASIGADLLIVCPDPGLAERVKARLRLARVTSPRVVVVTAYGQAAQRLTEYAAHCRHPVLARPQPAPTSQEPRSNTR